MILVVDDEKLQRELIRQALSPYYRVRTADSVDAAVSEARSERPLAVIMDYQMPGADGVEGFKRLRSDHPDLPVIFLTGHADLDVAQETLQLGATEYIIKPFEPWDIVSVVDRCVPLTLPRARRTGPINVNAAYAAKRRLVPNVDLWRSSLPTVPSANRAMVDLDGVRRAEAKVLRLSKGGVRTEIFDPLMPLVHDSPVKNLKVWVGNELAYDGAAWVRGVVDTGVSQVCEFALNGGWVKRKREAMPTGTDGIEGEARTFLDRAAASRTVRPAFRLAVADVVTFLSEMRAWCDAAELKWNRQLTGPDALHRLLRVIAPAMQSVFDGFEKEAALVEDNAMEAHVDLARSSLHPLLLCSPFIHRCYTKPLGYPGDFGLMNRMLDHPFEGDSLFARMVNGWLVGSAAGEAYRSRVAHLENVLAREASRQASTGRPLRTLSLGCGAAPETVRFVRHHEASEGAKFTLLDFNAETVSHANDEITAAAVVSGRNVRLNVQQYSVRQMLTAGERLLANRRLVRSGPVERGAFDVLYCAGLFDYLSDRVCARLLDVFWELAAPGALIVATNFTPANPIRRFMDYVLDWRLNYRNESEILRLVPSICPEGGFKLNSAAGSVEVILELRKPAASELPARRIQPASVAAI